MNKKSQELMQSILKANKEKIVEKKQAEKEKAVIDKWQPAIETIKERIKEKEERGIPAIKDKQLLGIF